MKFLLDMNLSPLVATWLKDEGFNAVHWTSVGDPRAADSEILDWAAKNGYVIITHDLDFGAMLAISRRSQPSVVQVRAQDVLDPQVWDELIAALRTHWAVLEAGALVSVDAARSRVRILPFAT